MDDNLEEKLRELVSYYIQCGIPRNDAIERLACVLTREPTVFNKYINLLNRLFEEE